MTKTVKKPAPQDWAPADVKCALEKAGWSMRQLSLSHGYSQHFCGSAFNQGGHNVQTIIADALGLKPWDIWPSRYDANHEPIMRRKPFSYIRPKNWAPPVRRNGYKDSAPAETCNGHVAEA